MPSATTLTESQSGGESQGDESLRRRSSAEEYDSSSADGVRNRSSRETTESCVETAGESSALRERQRRSRHMKVAIAVDDEAQRARDMRRRTCMWLLVGCLVFLLLVVFYLLEKLSRKQAEIDSLKTP